MKLKSSVIVNTPCAHAFTFLFPSTRSSPLMCANRQSPTHQFHRTFGRMPRRVYRRSARHLCGAVTRVSLHFLAERKSALLRLCQHYMMKTTQPDAMHCLIQLLLLQLHQSRLQTSAATPNVAHRTVFRNVKCIRY